MSLNRFAKRRDANEAEIVKALRDFGATVMLLDEPCDLLVGYQGKDYKMEVKTSTGRLTKNQETFIHMWQGSQIFIVRTSQEAIAILEIDSEASDRD